MQTLSPVPPHGPTIVAALVFYPVTLFQKHMPKIEVSAVAEILKKNLLDPKLLRQVIEEMNLAVQPDEGDGETPPALKKQFVILVSDPEDRFPKFDFVGWILQIPESESVATTQERIFRGAYDYNVSKKGRLFPATTVGEALENIPAKFFKEADLWAKTKTPVLVLKTDNKIPKEIDAAVADFRQTLKDAGASVTITTGS